MPPATLSPTPDAAAAPVPEPVVRGCTCAKLRRLTRRVTAVYDHALAPVGLRVTQYSLLAQLRGQRDEFARSGRPIAQLADTLDLDRTTLTRNLKPLVAAGWVEIEAGPADARQRLVRITAQGKAVLDVARAHWRRAQDEVTATIGAADAARLHRMLDDYLPRFRQAPDSD